MFLGALLMAGCSNVITPGDAAAFKTGGGAVRVSLGEPGSRTLFPSAAGLYYTLEFTDGKKTPVTAILDLTGESKNAETMVLLDVGTWTLTVKGFVDQAAAADAVNEVASGTVSVIVAANEITPVTVPLYGVLSASGTGSLSYTITFPTTVTELTLTYTNVGTVVGPVIQTFTDVSSGKVSDIITGLSAGYYQVGVKIIGGNIDAGKVEIVHILDRLTTELKYEFALSDFALVVPPGMPGTWSRTLPWPATVVFDADLGVSVTTEATAEDTPELGAFPVTITGRLSKTLGEDVITNPDDWFIVDLVAPPVTEWDGVEDGSYNHLHAVGNIYIQGHIDSFGGQWPIITLGVSANGLSFTLSATDSGVGMLMAGDYTKRIP
jgi:hypothetical protein